MSQKTLIKLMSEGDAKGKGKGHIIYSHKNKQKIKGRLEIKKYNPLVRKHTVYKESK